MRVSERPTGFPAWNFCFLHLNSNGASKTRRSASLGSKALTAFGSRARADEASLFTRSDSYG